MSDLIFTKSRKDIASSLFKKAKNAILEVIKQRLLDIPKFGIQASRKNLMRMKSEIEEAQLQFGSTDQKNLSFNASARSRGLESDELMYRFFGNYASTTNTIFLEGVILNLDYNPESLYRTLLHELSHFIDTSSLFRKDSKFTDNPFQRELLCLKRSDSSAAKSGDPDCFEKIATKYRKKDSSFSDLAKLTAKYLRKNPDVGLNSPQFPEGEIACQMGQLGEAYSDWMASEAYFIDKPKSEVNLQKGIYDRNSNRIIDVRERFKLNPELFESISGFCTGYLIESEISWTREKQKGIHPRTIDRLNAIILAHPIAKQSLGCSSAEIHALQSLGDKPLNDGVNYCGSSLYRSNKTK